MNYYIVRLAGTLVLAITVSLAAYSQLNDSISVRFERYRRQAYQEKMLVQLDRTSYLTGEELWFNINLVDESFHRPSYLSTVAYIEILDRSGAAALRTKVLLKDGHGAGLLFLSAQLTSGNYLFRAYTQWMKNCGSPCYFETFITIVNPFIRLETSSRADAEKWNATFFPEGGSLVDGLTTRVACMVRTRALNGIPFKGWLLDEKNDTLLSFSHQKFGIADFSFTPRSGKKYRVCIRASNHTTKFFPLPVARESGYALNIEDGGGFLKINVHTKGIEDGPVRLFAQSRLRVDLSEMRTVSEGKTTFSVSKHLLNDGVTQFTLFDPDLKPVCERLYFTYPQNVLPIEMTSASFSENPRKKFTLKIKSEPLTRFSVSVSRSDSLGQGRQSIISQLWLETDVDRHIEDPDFYFNEGRQDHSLIDNLMMTLRWKRTSWNEVLSNHRSKPGFFPEYRGHVVKGRVIQPNGEPAPHVQTYMTSPGAEVRLYESRSNRDGFVQYEVKNLFGRREVLAQTDLHLDTLSRIEILDPPSTEPARDSIPAFWLSPQLESQILTRSVAMQVQNIYRRRIESSSDNPTPDSLAFYGEPDETYFLDDYTRFPIVEEVMGEYVPGVFVRRRKGKVNFMVLDRVRGGLLKEDPLILIDGLPIFKTEQLLSFDVLKIKKLEVVTRKYFLGNTQFHGVISYSTYGRDLGGFRPDKQVSRYIYEGLQIPRQFKSPDYSDEQKRKSTIPDQRTLLHWDAEVITDRSGIKTIEFYTSDLPGQYRVDVSGVSPGGKPGKASLDFAVTRD